MADTVSYTITVFIVVLLAGCAVNLLRQHFIFQLAGIAFFFTYSLFKSIYLLNSGTDISTSGLYSTFLPMLSGVSACFVSMLLGFWIFPFIRSRFRE